MTAARGCPQLSFGEGRPQKMNELTIDLDVTTLESKADVGGSD